MSSCTVDCSSSIVVATLFNSYNDVATIVPSTLITDANLSYELDPVEMDYCEFRRIFYPNNSGTFHLNPAYCSCDAVKFNSQTITDLTGKQEFSLVDYVIAAYEECLQVSRDCFQPYYLIALEKELCKFASLCDICGTLCSLTWNQVYCLLEQYNVLGSKDNQQCFKVIFSYTNKTFCAQPVNIVFNYLVTGVTTDALSGCPLLN